VHHPRRVARRAAAVHGVTCGVAASPTEYNPGKTTSSCIFYAIM